MTAHGPEIVFFDAGGVLVWFPPAERRVRAALRSLGLHRPPGQIAAAVRLARAARDAAGPFDLVWPAAAEDERLLAAATILASALDLPQGRAGYLRDACYHIRNLRPYPDARPAIAELRAAGLRVGLISNAPSSLRAALHHLGLADRLDPLVISAEAGCRKPDAAIYRQAVEEAGLRPADAGRALFIDDLAGNVEGARAAGLQAWQLVREGPGGDLSGLRGLAARLR